MHRVGDAIIEHQLFATKMMHPQKVEQSFVAVIQRSKQFAGQAAIQERNALADGAAIRAAWETCD